MRDWPERPYEIDKKKKKHGKGQRYKKGFHIPCGIGGKCEATSISRDATPTSSIS